MLLQRTDRNGQAMATTRQASGSGYRGDERLVLDALAASGAAFASLRQLGPALDRLLKTALDVVGADAGSIMLLSRGGDTLSVVAARGPRAETILGSSQPAERSVAGWALRAGRSLLLHGLAGESRSDHPRDLASAIVVPLVVGQRVTGVLNASREPGAAPMDERGQRLLDLLSNQAAILIDNWQMMEELQRKEVRLEQLVDGLLHEPGQKQPEVARPEARRVPLTAREREVLQLLVEGLTNREIGKRLTVEVDTAKDHVQSILKKLGAADRTHAAALAVRSGLVA